MQIIITSLKKEHQRIYDDDDGEEIDAVLGIHSTKQPH